MKAAKLILMRHGQSEWNKNDLFTGWVDVPLSSQGIQEALEAGEFLKDLPISIVFTSTLIRAQMTLFLALSKRSDGKTPILLPRPETPESEWTAIHSQAALDNALFIHQNSALNERMYGELQGKNKQEMRDLYGDEQVHIWRRSYSTAPPYGESLEMTRERTLPYFEQTIAPHLENGEDVLVVAHGNSIRSIIMGLDDLSPEQITQKEIPLGKPLVYSYESGVFSKA